MHFKVFILYCFSIWHFVKSIYFPEFSGAFFFSCKGTCCKKSTVTKAFPMKLSAVLVFQQLAKTHPLLLLIFFTVTVLFMLNTYDKMCTFSSSCNRQVVAHFKRLVCLKKIFNNGSILHYTNVASSPK